MSRGEGRKLAQKGVVGEDGQSFRNGIVITTPTPVEVQEKKKTCVRKEGFANGKGTWKKERG